MQYQIGTTSVLEVRLKELLDENFAHKIFKIVNVFIKQKDYLYYCYRAIQVQIGNAIYEIYNKHPGMVQDVFVQNDDFITSESVLYTLKIDFNCIDIDSLTIPAQRNKIKFNIIKREEKYLNAYSDIINNLKQIVGHNSTCFRIQLANREIQEIEISILKDICPYQCIEYLEKL